MFYEIVNNLCKARKISITRMAEEIGLSNAAPTSWRRGSVPKLGTLKKISEYFNVSVEYLLGEEQKETPTPKSEHDPENEAIIEKLESDEALRAAVLRFLGM